MTAPDGSADGGEPAPITLRLLFYNAFLLRLRLPWPGGGPELAGKPACGARAVELGRAVAGRYDVVALAEVFDRVDRNAVLDGWTTRQPVHAVGPRRSFVPLALKSSGLVTILDGPILVRRAAHRFRQRGAYRRDADAFSNKGVLLTEVDVGARGNVEIYSTHLIAGNDFLRKRPGGPYRANADLRQQQADELVGFIGRSHRAGNAAVVVGDFNVPADDQSDADPGAQYQALCDAMAGAGFDDLWTAHGSGPGFTGLGQPIGVTCRPDPVAPDLCAEPADPSNESSAARIDYAWLQRPVSPGTPHISVRSFRRRAFRRDPRTDGYRDLPFLSDHLALDLELAIEARRGARDRSTPREGVRT